MVERAQLLQGSREFGERLPSERIRKRHLQQDGSTCTYPSGAVVSFDTPVALPITKEPDWTFSLTVGTPCLRYENKPQNDFVLTVTGSTFSTSLGQDGSMTCPDKTSYSTDNVPGLLGCPLPRSLAIRAATPPRH